MNVRIVADILTIEQCDAAIRAAVMGHHDAKLCAEVADLYRTRARLWRELADSVPMVRDEFLQAARECANRSLNLAKDFEQRARDGRR